MYHKDIEAALMKYHIMLIYITHQLVPKTSNRKKSFRLYHKRVVVNSSLKQNTILQNKSQHDIIINTLKQVLVLSSP